MIRSDSGEFEGLLKPKDGDGKLVLIGLGSLVRNEIKERLLPLWPKVEFPEELEVLAVCPDEDFLGFACLGGEVVLDLVPSPVLAAGSASCRCKASGACTALASVAWATLKP